MSKRLPFPSCKAQRSGRLAGLKDLPGIRGEVSTIPQLDRPWPGGDHSRIRWEGPAADACAQSSSMWPVRSWFRSKRSRSAMTPTARTH